MNLVFVSNYLNHHQIPFCNAMYQELDGNFAFIQTEPMEEERIKMGWQQDTKVSYVKYYKTEPEACQNMIENCDVLIYGGAEEEGYLKPRLEAHKPIFRYSERLYKEGQWKAVSPRGLKKKYEDHGKYRKDPVYLLCAGAYVASDYQIVRAYPRKMFRWGYFPETRQYEMETLLDRKGFGENRVLYLLWAGRFLQWKHPELAVETARYLKSKGITFHLDMIGGGEQEHMVRERIEQYGLEDCVRLLGFRKPEEVRSYMEKADIYLATSNRQEGWGAVINEAMNSGCAVVADHMMGAAPYLVRQQENGMIYKDGNEKELYTLVERLALDSKLRRRLGRNAYETIVSCWNPENAAACLMKLIRQLQLVEEGKLPQPKRNAVWIADGPGSPDPVIGEREMYRYLTR